MVQIIWTETALQELDEIADYTSLDNPIAAKKLVRNAFERVELLAWHPESGKQIDMIEESRYREIVLPPCRIFYRIADDMVYIIHVIREQQLLHWNILKSR